MYRRLGVGILALLVALLTHGTVVAGLASNPQPANSWFFDWNEIGYSPAPPGVWAAAPFDTIAMQIVTPGQVFDYPAFVNFAASVEGPSNWGLYRQQGALAVAHTSLGGFGGEVDLRIRLAGAFSTPLEIDYVVYAQDGTRLLSQRISWNGAGGLFVSAHLPNGWNPGRANLLVAPACTPTPAGW